MTIDPYCGWPMAEEEFRDEQLRTQMVGDSVADRGDRNVRVHQTAAVACTVRGMMSTPHPDPNYTPRQRLVGLDGIATLLRELTYEEMIALGAAINTSPEVLHQWSNSCLS